MPILIAVLIALLIGGGVLAVKSSKRDHVVSVSPAVCTCDDYDDMKRRRAEAEAAQAHLNNDIIPNTPGNEMFTGEAKEATLPSLQAAVKSVKVSAGRTGKGETPPSCETSVTAPTPCLREALQSHENVHAQACDAYISKGNKGDYKNALTMADYWREDARGYAAEKAYLDQELNRLFNDMNCMHYSTYPGMETRGEQQQRLAGAKRRVANYVQSIS